MKFRTEAEFILKIRALAARRSAGLWHGMGDDAAVFEGETGTCWCITTDLLIEDTHFDLRFDTAPSVGHRSLAAGLSDIAAMGAIPRFALVSVAVPSREASRFLSGFYRGFLALGDRHHVTLIGGDTSRSSDRIYVDVIVLGEATKGHAVLRSGARPGDHIFVTGELGKAAVGLSLLKSGKTRHNRIQQQAIKSHCYPSPRSLLGAWLGRNRLPSAMIDVSDGLSTDLHHLCEESRVGARIFEDQIPVLGKKRSEEALANAFSGGEDYELLFAVRPDRMGKIRGRNFRVSIHRIGTIIPRRDGIVCVNSAGVERRLPMTGWDHFRRRRL